MVWSWGHAQCHLLKARTFNSEIQLKIYIYKLIENCIKYYSRLICIIAQSPTSSTSKHKFVPRSQGFKNSDIELTFRKTAMILERSAMHLNIYGAHMMTIYRALAHEDPSMRTERWGFMHKPRLAACDSAEEIRTPRKPWAQRDHKCQRSKHN